LLYPHLYWIKKKHLPILLILVTFLVIILPSGFYIWFIKKNSTKKVNETLEKFYELLNENILMKEMPFVLGQSHEYAKIKFKSSQQLMDKFWKEHQHLMPDHKEVEISIGNKNAICLIYAYLNNHPFTSKELKSDIKKILKYAPVAFTNMLNMALIFSKFHAVKKDVKNFGYNCIKTIFEFSQIIYQRSSLDSSEPLVTYLQLPNVNLERIKSLRQKYNSPEVMNSFKLSTLQNVPAESRKKYFEREFNEEEIQEIEHAIESIPQYDLKVEYFTEGFDEFVVGDFLTIEVTVERKNLKEGIVIFN